MRRSNVVQARGKRLIPFLVAALALVTWLTAQAEVSVTLAWDPPPGETQVIVRHVLYCGTASGNYTAQIEVGPERTCTVPGLQEGQTYFFVVTAVNEQGLESDPSNELCYTPGYSLVIAADTDDPTKQDIKFHALGDKNIVLEASSDLLNWDQLWYTPPLGTTQWMELIDEDSNSPLFPVRFYRLVLY